MATTDGFDFRASAKCFYMEDNDDDDNIDGFGVPDVNGDGKGDFWDIFILAWEAMRLPDEWREDEGSVTYDRAENTLNVKYTSPAQGQSYEGSWDSDTGEWSVYIL